ncbi:alpha/beta fold hydrolase [Mesorhizobium xinjiangense]|uniref:alpha/beta fold hydrolase n=1 Tax=Mesorhizobium xinjiangense TaxID=2678685 RepID=UPI0012ED044E|nr:alpha/beta fold hydrolase [Mesorhizobium xinjiangense]
MTGVDRLFAREMGSGGTPAVFLHGFGGVGGVWAPLQEAVASDRFILAYDLPGHGQSLSFPEAGPVKIAVKAVLADLAARGIERAHLVGHSMGGAIATLTALSQPQRVASLSLIAPGGFGEEINAPLLKRYAGATDDASIRVCLAAMSGPQHDVPDDVVNKLAAARAAAGQTEMLAHIAGLITRDGKQGAIPRESLAGLDMPVAVLWGTADSVLPYKQTRGLPPRFALHTFDGDGHMLAEEQPDEVLFIVRQMMR